MKTENSKKPWKVTVSVTLEEEIVEELKKRAEESYRSFSQYVGWVLKQYLSKEKKDSY
ncbi:MAG: toxin-antitoxin system protein [Clostridia bacterium]|nr:toxin-antitoxin system protein [Clostridia bacterium]